MTDENATLVVFDLDGTLTPDHSVWESIHKALGTWDGKGETHLKDWQDGKIEYEEFAKVDAGEWKGVHIDKIREIVEGIPVLPGAREVVEYLKSKGCRIAIISSGLDVLAGRVAEEIGVKEHYSNKLLTGKDGCLTGKVQISVPAERPGEYLTHGKAGVLTNIQKKYDIPPDQTITIGDSESDIPMFLRSGASYAINNANAVTKSAAAYYASDLPALKELLEAYFNPPEKTDEGFEGASFL
jgi:phosphoserine phosphatase